MFQQQRISIKNHAEPLDEHSSEKKQIKIDSVLWIMRMNVIKRNEGISLVLNHVPTENSIVLHYWFYMRSKRDFGGCFFFVLARLRNRKFTQQDRATI